MNRVDYLTEVTRILYRHGYTNRQLLDIQFTVARIWDNIVTIPLKFTPQQICRTCLKLAMYLHDDRPTAGSGFNTDGSDGFVLSVLLLPGAVGFKWEALSDYTVRATHRQSRRKAYVTTLGLIYHTNLASISAGQFAARLVV